VQLFADRIVKDRRRGGKMLKRISPLLNADVLQALAAMGHGDDLIIADTNFPADSVARSTIVGKPLRIDAPSAVVVRAVLSLYPLDSFVDDAAARMEIVGSPNEMAPVQQEVQKEIDDAEGKPWPMVGIERYAFYERAKNAYCVIQTGELRFYGCFALRKGVIPPDAG
jgi:L-fucose mutarotase